MARRVINCTDVEDPAASMFRVAQGNRFETSHTCRTDNQLHFNPHDSCSWCQGP
jgi:hypothetical protein